MWGCFLKLSSLACPSCSTESLLKLGAVRSLDSRSHAWTRGHMPLPQDSNFFQESCWICGFCSTLFWMLDSGDKRVGEYKEQLFLLVINLLYACGRVCGHHLANSAYSSLPINRNTLMFLGLPLPCVNVQLCETVVFQITDRQSSPLPFDSYIFRCLFPLLNLFFNPVVIKE